MTEPDNRDAAIGALYRGLPREEPPPAIDAAVLESARDHVAPSRKRWMAPLSLAAVLVLAVVVTLRMESERPEVATMQAPATSPPSQPLQPPQPPPPPQSTAPVAPSAPPPPAPARSKPKPAARADAPAAAAPSEPKAPRASRESLRRQDSAKPEAARPSEDRASVPGPATPAAPPSVAPTAASAAASSSPAPIADVQEKSAERAEQAPAQAQPSAKSAASDSGLQANAQLWPEQWLERIAVMRTEGRNIEAEVNLAEFRRRHPKFQISPEMRERIARQR
jgi:hypothetical protein